MNTKKTLLMAIVALFTVVPAMAQFARPGSPNAFYNLYGNGRGIKDKAQKTKVKDLVDYARMCNLGTEKIYDKQKALYEEMKKKYPEEQVLIDCAFGQYMIRCGKEMASQEEAFRLVNDNVAQISSDDKLRTARSFYHALLAHCYINGTGTSQNLEKAFAEYEQAAGQDSLYTYALATCYYLGVGTEVDEDKAYKYYADAFLNAVMNNRNGYDAYERLVAIIMNRQSTLDKSAIDDYRAGLRILAVTKDRDQALQLLTRAAEAKLPSAMYEVAILHNPNSALNAAGIGTTEKKAAKDAFTALAEQAASAGYVPAKFLLGLDTFLKVNNVVLAVQSNKFFADAYAIFEPLANMEYGPAVVQVANYDRNGWPKKSNLLGDIAKTAATVAGAAKATKRGGLKGLGNWSKAHQQSDTQTNEAAANARVDAFLESLRKDAQ